MSLFLPRKIIIPAFILTEVCCEHDSGALLRQVKTTAPASDYSYHFRPVIRGCEFEDKEDGYKYNLLPIIINGDGIPWKEACLYIFSRLEASRMRSMSTYTGIALDLVDFKKFLAEDGVDFTLFPSKKLFRPTYRYRGNLLQRIELNEISENTAKRRISTMIAFYRWMMEKGLLVPANPPWVNKISYINFADSFGSVQTKYIYSTDLAIRIPKQDDPYSGMIEDEGKLRPLPENEQILLLKILYGLGNTEMILIHLVALFTGARIQTVLTFRVGHVSQEQSQESTEVRIPVGPGSGADTKKNKKMTLFFPKFIYEMLRIYSFSDRAKKRYIKAGGIHEKQYLFLSNRGIPFYRSKFDNNIFDESLTIRHEKNGQAIRQYMRDRIIPRMRKILGDLYRYKFHDLKATYGMNQTDQQTLLVSEGKKTPSQAREYVKTRMGHTSAKTTDRYLNYRQNNQLFSSLQSEYEGYLQSLVQKLELGGS